MGTNLWIPLWYSLDVHCFDFSDPTRSIGIGVHCWNANVCLERETLSARWQTRGDQAGLSSLQMHTCTHHPFQITSDVLLSPKIVECNILKFGRQKGRVSKEVAMTDTNSRPWKTSRNISERWQKERKKMPQKPPHDSEQSRALISSWMVACGLL